VSQVTVDNQVDATMPKIDAGKHGQKSKTYLFLIGYTNIK
jgi:hypothetical protein